MTRPIVHWEFWSQNPGQVSDFYKEVFDWPIRNIPEMDYNLMDPGDAGGIGGGIMKPGAAELTAKTCLYIDVDDLAAYRDKVTAAGGKLLIEEQVVPGVGAFALFADPDGRVMGLWKQG